MNPKDVIAIRGLVIGTLRSRYTHKELLLKIVDVATRGSKAYINVVYHGKVPKAEVAIQIVQSILSSMRDRPRLRKFTYLLITVSKTGSRRGSKFLVSLRIPKALYTLLYRIVQKLKEYNINVRKWNVKHVGTATAKFKVHIHASTGLPEINIKDVIESLKSLASRVQIDQSFCVLLDIKARTRTYSESICIESSPTY